MHFDVPNSLYLCQMTMFLRLHCLIKLIIHLHLSFEIENHVDLLRFDWNKVNLHYDNVSKILLSLQAYYMFQTSVFGSFEIENQGTLNWNRMNLHCDNVSKISLSLQAYYMFQTSVFRTFEIQNQVDLLRFDSNKVSLHFDNVSKLTLSLQTCLCTLMFQIHCISVK